VDVSGLPTTVVAAADPTLSLPHDQRGRAAQRKGTDEGDSPFEVGRGSRFVDGLDDEVAADEVSSVV
jgi:hypothetical protein